MYKVLHKIFGWDYIHWSSPYDENIAKVFVLPDGDVCYWQCRCSHVLKRIHSKSDVTWLTCKPEKYFKEEK